MGFWDYVEKATETATEKVADGLERAVRYGADDLDRTIAQGGKAGLSIWGTAPPPPKASSEVSFWGETRPAAKPKKERSIWDAPGDDKDEKNEGGFSWW